MHKACLLFLESTRHRRIVALLRGRCQRGTCCLWQEIEGPVEQHPRCLGQKRGRDVLLRQLRELRAVAHQRNDRRYDRPDPVTRVVLNKACTSKVAQDGGDAQGGRLDDQVLACRKRVRAPAGHHGVRDPLVR